MKEFDECRRIFHYFIDEEEAENGFTSKTVTTESSLSVSRAPLYKKIIKRFYRDKWQ